jgi:hypothetical protein
LYNVPDCLLYFKNIEWISKNQTFLTFKTNKSVNVCILIFHWMPNTFLGGYSLPMKGQIYFSKDIFHIQYILLSRVDYYFNDCQNIRLAWLLGMKSYILKNLSRVLWFLTNLAIKYKSIVSDLNCLKWFVGPYKERFSLVNNQIFFVEML